MRRVGQLFCFLLATSCDPGWDVREKARQEHAVQFRDVAARAGLVAEFRSGTRKKKFIVEAKGGGAAAFLDYDLDGDLDLYVLNGSQLGGVPAGEERTNKLYRNDGAVFADATTEAGVGHTGWGMGVTTADYDNDGDPDIYVANFGANALYRNEGDGTFSDVTSAAGVGDGRWSTGCSFADYDTDGDLDLYVANYVDFDLDRRAPIEQSIRWRGVEIFRGPQGLKGARDILYRNEGDGTFRDATTTAGVEDEGAYYGLGAVWGDFDNDGDADLFVANDSVPNYLYQNEGDGTFREIATEAGVAHSADGHAQAGMGCAFDDYNNDGWLDILVTHFSMDSNALYRNEGEATGSFGDISYAAGLGQAGWASVGWGTGFIDFDNDGDKDLFVANGHVYPHVADYNLGESYAQLNQLFENLGGDRFADVSAQAGPGLTVRKVSRGAIFGDFDNDGDVDIFVAELDNTPTLLRNDGGNAQHWLMVQTVGTASNRDGVGARVRVVADSLVQIREVRAGDSFLSRSDPRLHFGLGTRAKVDLLEIRWPSGGRDRLRDLEADRLIVVREGEGIVRSDGGDG